MSNYIYDYQETVHSDEIDGLYTVSSRKTKSLPSDVVTRYHSLINAGGVIVNKMTDEEYEQLKEDVNSEDVMKRIRASFTLKMFPTKETKYKVGEDTLGVFDETLRSVLEKELK